MTLSTSVGKQQELQQHYLIHSSDYPMKYESLQLIQQSQKQRSKNKS